MKLVCSTSIILISIFISSCMGGQIGGSKNNLGAQEFFDKINENPQSWIIDVRTEEEFNNGHLQKAQNIIWNDSEFEKNISTLNKTEPIFVYCLSGGRSSSAASKMRTLGFAQVFELSGGIMKWRAANLPEASSDSPRPEEMSIQQFLGLTQTNTLVLVDFYAEWCAPCKKMKPYLDEISKDLKEKVTVIRIDADANQQLMKELQIEELPILHLYKYKELIWSNSGYIDKAGVIEQLN